MIQRTLVLLSFIVFTFVYAITNNREMLELAQYCGISYLIIRRMDNDK